MSKVFCKHCNAEIGSTEGGKILFDKMKSISKVEIDYIGINIDVKCHSCHNWNKFDKDGNQVADFNRKAREHLKI